MGSSGWGVILTLSDEPSRTSLLISDSTAAARDRGCCDAGSSDSSADSGSVVNAGTGFGESFTSGVGVSVSAASGRGERRESESGACSGSNVVGGEDVEGKRDVEGTGDGLDGSVVIAVSSSHGMAVV